MLVEIEMRTHNAIRSPLFHTYTYKYQPINTRSSHPTQARGNPTRVVLCALAAPALCRLARATVRRLPLRTAAWPGLPREFLPAPSPLCVLANRPPPAHGPHSRTACRARWSAERTWPTARAAPPKLQLGELIVCGMGWRARGRECGAQQREIGPNQRSCAGAKGLRREERHGRQGSASCRVRSSCRVGKLAAG
jgi:hypothetical protein